MKDRYLCVALLVGQACWEASPDKDDDVADHPSESHNIVLRVMGVIMESQFVPTETIAKRKATIERIARSSQPGWLDANGARLKEQATPESWSVPRIGWEVRVPRPLAERRRFAK